jgi:HNH endonuclease
MRYDRHSRPVHWSGTMKLRKAEKMTGYVVRRLEESQADRIAFGAFDGERLVAQAENRFEELALEALVRAVYQIHCREVLQKHGWQCARCKSRRPLQIHHRCYRSHGGTHAAGNLEPVCWQCHKIIHKYEKSE